MCFTRILSKNKDIVEKTRASILDFNDFQSPGCLLVQEEQETHEIDYAWRYKIVLEIVTKNCMKKLL